MHDDHHPKGEKLESADAPILLAILLAARRTGDRLLETVARRELMERHGVKVRVMRGPTVPEVPDGE